MVRYMFDFSPGGIINVVPILGYATTLKFASIDEAVEFLVSRDQGWMFVP